MHNLSKKLHQLQDHENVTILNEGPFDCKKCNKDFIRKKKSLDCPICSSQGMPNATGKELTVDAIEVE